MTIEKPTVLDMETIAYNLHVEGRNSRSEMLYKFVAEYKANIQKLARLTAIETAARELVNNLPEFEIELARENWGNTNTRIILDKRATLAALLEKRVEG